MSKQVSPDAEWTGAAVERAGSSRLLRRATRVCGGLIAALGAMALVGWATSQPVLLGLRAMIDHLYSDFLNDDEQYRLAESYWESLWQQIGYDERDKYGWMSPWLSTGSPTILDGNPIFSAWSPVLRRGLRIIQHEPTSSKPELIAYLDTVGGTTLDPESVKELVISCALSKVAADEALSLMRDWVANKPVSFDRNLNGMAARVQPLWGLGYGDYLNPAA